MNIRTIRVTGKGLLKIKPDQTCIFMDLEGVEEKYEDTVRRSSEDTKAVKDALEKVGIAQENVRTTSFDIEPQYEGYEEKGVWKQAFKGYRFTHSLRFVFDMDKELLGKIFGALAACPANPQFRVSYRVKDQESAKKLLLASAVSDAKEKAEILTLAAGVSLKEIRHIDYSFGAVQMEVMPMNRLKAAGGVACCADYEMSVDMNPEDIEVSDTVTVVWELG